MLKTEGGDSVKHMFKKALAVALVAGSLLAGQMPSHVEAAGKIVKAGVKMHHRMHRRMHRRHKAMRKTGAKKMMNMKMNMKKNGK